jgi:lipopolysaccharide export LptBFGC system permease protein LptF
METTQILLILLISGLTISFICAIMSLWLSIRAHISIEAMQKSTHQLEYVPFDPKESKIEEFEENQQFDMPEMDPADLDETEIDLRKMI